MRGVSEWRNLEKKRQSIAYYMFFLLFSILFSSANNSKVTLSEKMDYHLIELNAA